MKHKRIIFISLLLLLISFMSLYTFAQGVGYIQIKCEPGAIVFLNNNFVGNTSSELGGLILQDVPAGSHEIKIVKGGFEPQSVEIDLKVNEIYVYEVKEFIPKLDVIQKGEADTDTIKQRAGSLLVETIPIDCVIEIPKLNINKEHYGNKTKKTWEISNIPIGSYTVSFIALGKEIEYELKIEEGIQKHLLVNVLKDEVKEILPPCVTFSVGAGNGTIEVRADGNPINSGDLVKVGTKIIFKATPDAGQMIRSWEVDGRKRNTLNDNTYIIENLQSAIDFKVYFDIKPYKIGDKGPAGGWIFYDKGSYSDGWRYLEAAPKSTEWTDKQWDSFKTLIGGTETGIGTGQSNTTKIIDIQGTGHTYAAQLCDALVYGGYIDWFLPSKDELNLMYKNLKVNNNNIGGIASDSHYWSSSAGNGYNAWCQSFSSGHQNYGNEDYYFVQVRAVRAF